MAITALGRRKEVEVIDSAGALLKEDEPLRYESIVDAINALKVEVAKGDDARLQAALIIREIERRELYRQMEGVTTMKAFFAQLWPLLESVSWKSTTSIKRYLALVKLYIEQLNINPAIAIKVASHYFILSRLADIDRKTGELRIEASKDDKLGSSEFEAVTQLVTFMRTGFTREQMVSGLDEAETQAALEAAGMLHQAGVYKELMGHDIQMPPKGWSTADTQALVDRITGKVEGEDEEEDSDEKIHRVWVGYETFGGSVRVERIEFRRGEVKLNEIEVERDFTVAEFEILRGGDAAQIAGQQGEQNGEE